jgi:hypothetical protein
MPSNEAKREARRALEGRLLQERALFAGCLTAFAFALYLDISVSTFYDPFVFVLVALSGLTGAGLDGAREGLKDLDLLGGLLDHEGVGARIVRVPFWSRGHYEVWIETPAPGGSRRLGLSFANSLLFREKKSRYLLMFPLAPGKHLLEKFQPKVPYTQTGTGGSLQGKSIEFWLWRPVKGPSAEWRLLMFVAPGRPIDLPGLLDLKRRGEELAEKIAREGARAVPWGTGERFEAMTADEIPAQSRAELREP